MKPQTADDKLRNEPHIADVSIFIGYAATKYNKAFKMKVDKKKLPKELLRFRGINIEQGVKDLPTCKLDIDEIKKTVIKYGVTDMGRNNRYLLDFTPTYKRVFKVRTSIAKRLKAGPDKTYLLIYAVAGHGM